MYTGLGVSSFLAMGSEKDSRSALLASSMAWAISTSPSGKASTAL